MTWAFVANQQTGRISLNPDYTIEFIRVVILLLLGILFLIFGQILLRHTWNPSHRYPSLTAERKELLWNGGLLLATIWLVFLPVSLSAKTQNAFRVSIPYRDMSIERQIGARRWGDRSLCLIRDIAATDAAAAADSATARFKRSAAYLQLIQPAADSSRVTLDPDMVIAQHK